MTLHRSKNIAATPLPILSASRGSDRLGYAALLRRSHAQADRVAQLRADVQAANRERDDAIVRLETAVSEAVSAARAEERKVCDAEATQVVNSCETALKAARAQFDDFLRQSDELSRALVCAALATVFDDAETRAETLSAAISKSIETLGRDTVLSVRLNPVDFGAPSDLEAHLPGLAAMNLSMEIDPRLDAGMCEFDLLVGRYAISLPQHWTDITALITAPLDVISDADAKAVA